MTSEKDFYWVDTVPQSEAMCKCSNCLQWTIVYTDASGEETEIGQSWQGDEGEELARDMCDLLNAAYERGYSDGFKGVWRLRLLIVPCVRRYAPRPRDAARVSGGRDEDSSVAGKGKGAAMVDDPHGQKGRGGGGVNSPVTKRVLVACEFSGAVRDAFAALGWDAWSCDTEPSETKGQHYQGDVRDFLEAGWDLLIGHPPCTHLAVSGARWFKDKRDEQAHALGFVQQLWSAPVDRVAIENPVSILSSRWRKPDQIIQPWQFGHGEVKATCLWLRGLPKLQPTNIVDGREPRVHFASPGPDRWKERSRTLQGIADAMAAQWGGLVPATKRTAASLTPTPAHAV